MKTNILLSIIFTLLLGCSRNDSLKDEISAIKPECLQPLILDALQFGPTTPSANVAKFLYQGEEVFLLNFMNDFPDGQSFVVSSDCEPICALGGIDGPANDCKNFDSAIFIKIIWTDPR